MEIAILAGSDVFIGYYMYLIQSFSASNFHHHRFILILSLNTSMTNMSKYGRICTILQSMYLQHVSIYWIHMECTYRVLILDDTSLADFCIFIPELLFLTIKIGGALFVV